MTSRVALWRCSSVGELGLCRMLCAFSLHTHLYNLGPTEARREDDKRINI